MLFKSIVVGELSVNCFVLACEKTRQAIIVDPGDDAPAILDLVKEDDLQIVEIVATHGHFDHIGCTASVIEATGAPFAVHRADLYMVEGLQDIAGFFGLKTDPPPKVDRFIDEGDTVRFGEESLGILHVPGHAPGNIALTWPGHAIVGDTVFAGSIGRTDFENSNHQQLLSSIQNKLFTLPDSTQLYPGHGPATTVGQEKRTNPFLQ